MLTVQLRQSYFFNSPPFVEEIEMQETKLFTEIFPVNIEALPELTAYKLEVSGSDNVDEIGYKLCYRLKQDFVVIGIGMKKGNTSLRISDRTKKL